MAQKKDVIQEKNWPGRTYGLALAVVTAVFFGRIAVLAFAELWYDEVLSLMRFVLQPQSLAEVFSDYRIANNHILSNALEWIWIHLGLAGAGFSEFMVRLPAIAFSIGTILYVGNKWRPLLGRRCALLAAALLAASPVFFSFAWQMRGYAMAIFLSACAVTLGGLRVVKKGSANGVALFIVSLLIPLVMPSAAMLPLSVALAMFAVGLSSDGKGRFLRCVQLAFPAGTGALLGVGYYVLFLWDMFVYASHEAGGWQGFWLTLGGIVIPFALHCAVPLLLWGGYAIWRGKHSQRRVMGTDTAKGQGATVAPVVCRYASWLVVASGLAVICILLLHIPNHRYPFPRVFLPLLPAVTFSAVALMAGMERNFHRQVYKWTILEVMAITIFGVAVGYLCDCSNDSALRQAVTRQNLLVQYYRGKDDNRMQAAFIWKQYQQAGKSYLLIVPDIDGMSANYYNAVSQAAQDDGKQYVAIAVGMIEREAVWEYVRDGCQLLVSARTEDEAGEFLGRFYSGEQAELEPIYDTEFRRLYKVNLR